jgi:hypothetical protein
MFVHSNYLVGTTSVLVASIPKAAGPTLVTINNRDNQDVFIGDSDITASVGINGGNQVDAGGTTQLWLSGGDVLYAISNHVTPSGAVAVSYSYIPKDYPV